MSNFITDEDIAAIISALTTGTDLAESTFLAEINNGNIIKALLQANYLSNHFAIAEEKKMLFCGYATGASRLVLFPTNKDYVIKIPYRGFFCHTDNDVKKSPFTAAYASVDPDLVGWDYCDAEEMLFRLAENNGVGEYFAETIKIGEVRGYPIYAQPRAKMISLSNIREREDYSSIEQISSQITEEYSDILGEDFLPEYWMKEFIAAFSDDELEGLLNFIEETGISDLHEENVGFINGKPIIFDYVGYRG